MAAILLFLRNNWKAIAVALLALALFFWGYHTGAHNVQAKWDAQKLVDSQALVAAQTGVITQEHRAETLTLGVSNDYEKSVAGIDGNYAAFIDGLRPSAQAGISLPAIPEAPGGHNAATCTHGLPDTDKAHLVAVAKDADIQTQRLMACQAWIRAQASAR